MKEVDEILVTLTDEQKQLLKDTISMVIGVVMILNFLIMTEISKL